MDVLAYIMSKKYVDQVISDLDSLQGKSAYEIAVEQGFSGTEAEWLKSLEGESGVYVGSGEMPDDCNVQIDPQGDASQVVLCTPQELTTEQQAQARQNIGAIETPETAEAGQTIVVKEVDENGKPTAWEAADFPAGGSGSQNFSVVETIEKAVTSYTVLLPVNLGKALIFNVHITFPSVETEFKLLCSSGQSGYAGWTIPVNSREVGANLYAVRHSENKSNSGTTVAKDYTYAARPELGATGWLNSSGMSNKLSLQVNSDGVELPAGTKIEVWGICE